MSNFSLDIIGKALPKIGYKSKTYKPVDDWGQKTLFKNVIMGSQGVDGVEIDYGKYSPQVAVEAVRGEEPTRLNYKSKFNANYLIPAYFHNSDFVTIEDADARVLGEDVNVNTNTQARIAQKFAEIRDAIHDSYTGVKEKMVWDVILTGTTITRNGSQASPITSSLLSQAGANMYSNFLSTIATAVNNVRKVNKSARMNALVLNPTYAMLLVSALKTAGLYDKDALNLAVAHFGGIMDGGAEICGAVNAPGCPNLAIVAYYGNDGTNDYITNQKAVLCNLEQGIGSIAYGRIQAFTPGIGPHYVVEQERYTPIEIGYGDTRQYGVEVQSAAVPVITNVDGYCVFTSIPTSV